MSELVLQIPPRLLAALDRRTNASTDEQRAQWVLRILKNELRQELDQAREDIVVAIQRLPKADRDGIAAKIGLSIPATGE